MFSVTIEADRPGAQAQQGTLGQRAGARGMRGVVVFAIARDRTSRGCEGWRI